MSQIIFGVWEIGWESSHLEGLYLSKESAQKAMIQFINEKHKETELIYSGDEDGEGNEENNKKMIEDLRFKYDKKFDFWANGLESIHIREHELKS